MYSLFLILSVAAVILSPLALELWLTLEESRAHRRHMNRSSKAKGPDVAWASGRARW